MGSSYRAGGEMVMCPPESSSGGGRATARRGGKTKAAAEQKANKQPQRGLGVAQLEKIRLHNQMMAAYHRSGGGLHQDAGSRMQVPFAAPSAGSPPFQPPHHDCSSFGRGVVGVQYYDNLLPYSGSSSSPPPPLFAHGLRDSSGQRLGQGRREQPEHGSGSAEELDLELRL